MKAYGQQILAVSTGGLGDAVLFSPVLRSLKGENPSNQVTLLLANSLAASVYGKSEVLHEVLMIDFKRNELLRNAIKMVCWVIQALVLKRKYDIAVFATGLNPALSLIIKLTGISRKTVCAPGPPVCSTDLACNVALARRFDDTVRGADAFIPAVDSVENETIRITRKFGIELGVDDVMCVYPSTDLPHRPRWPLENLLMIMKRFKENRFGWKIIVVGSASEGRDWDEVDTEGISDANLAGKLSIHETAFLLKKSLLTFGNDGGLMHVAGSVGCPLVDVMTNTPHRYKPPGHKTVVVHSALACCDNLYPKRPANCLTARCTEDISIEMVYNACMNFVTKH